MPFETVLVRFYAPDKIREMTADEIELVAPDAMSSTSAEGKFTAKVPNGEYIVIADASRAANKQIEYYHWKLPLTVSSEKNNIILNNQNLLGE